MRNNNKRLSNVIATPDAMPSKDELKKEAAHKAVVLKMEGGTAHSRLIAMCDALLETIKQAKWSGGQVNLDLSFMIGLITNCAQVAEHTEAVEKECETIKAILRTMVKRNPQLFPTGIVPETSTDAES